MSKNISEIPFTEIVERASELARERADVRPKVRGVINDVYTREIPRKWDWSFYLVSSAITLIPEYATGTVTATTGGTSVTFTGATIPTTQGPMQLKISGNDYVYTFTASSSSNGTISPPLSGTQNVASASYSLTEPYYSLAPDFDRFPKNGGIVDYRGGTENVIPESPYQEWTQDFVSSATDRPERCRILGQDTMGNYIVEINPPPKSSRSLRVDYLTHPKPLRETTAGLVGSVSASGTSVVGDSNTKFTEANTGDYFRIDAFGKGSDSEWYKIISIQNNSTLTLQMAFGLSGATSANYTICPAPNMPYRMQPAVLYGTLVQLAADQDDPLYQAYNLKLAEVLSDGKKNFTTRIYNQEIHTIAEEYLYRR